MYLQKESEKDKEPKFIYTKRQENSPHSVAVPYQMKQNPKKHFEIPYEDARIQLKSNKLMQSQVISNTQDNPAYAVSKPMSDNIIQRKRFTNIRDVFNTVFQIGFFRRSSAKDSIESVINQNAALSVAYRDACAYLDNMDFVPNTNISPKNPHVSTKPVGKIDPTKNDTRNLIYQIDYAPYPAGINGPDFHKIASYILHEMLHVATLMQYEHAPSTDEANNSDSLEFANYRVPDGSNDLQQIGEIHNIMNQIDDTAYAEFKNAPDIYNAINSRTGYAAEVDIYSHFDTVLFDLLYYLQRTVPVSQTYRLVNYYLEQSNTRRNDATAEQSIRRLDNPSEIIL